MYSLTWFWFWFAFFCGVDALARARRPSSTRARFARLGNGTFEVSFKRRSVFDGLFVTGFLFFAATRRVARPPVVAIIRWFRSKTHSSIDNNKKRPEKSLKVS